MTLIYDLNQVKKFYKEVLGTERGPFDVDFFCVAARKKYMTPEERQLTQLGDTCMMEKTPVREYDENIFIHKLQKVDSCLDHLYSHNGTNIPRSCMVLYMNVNHTSMIEALKGLKIDLALFESELYDIFTKNGLREGVGNKIKRLDNLTLKAYQNPKNISKRTWVDIDIDVEGLNQTSINATLDNMIRSKVHPLLVITEKPYIIIGTHGGYHILVNTQWISGHNRAWAKYAKDTDMNLKSGILFVEDFTKSLKALMIEKNLDAKEIKVNQNAMVPIPGTLQGGKEVRIW